MRGIHILKKKRQILEVKISNPEQKIYSTCHTNEAKAELKALWAASLTLFNRGTFTVATGTDTQPTSPTLMSLYSHNMKLPLPTSI